MKLQHFTSGSSVRKRETPGILSRMFPPFAGITSYRVRSQLAHLIAMLCFVVLCLLYIYCFFHLFSPVDPETAVDALVIHYVDEDTSSFSAELPGKQTPLEHSNIAHFFPSHACIRTATTFYMILL